MKSLSRVLLIMLLSLGVLAASSSATILVSRTAREIGAASPLVARGRVAGVRSFWNEKHTRIFTEVQVAVDQTYKGQAPPVVRVEQPGGVVGNVRMHVAGVALWRLGEEVLLFLEPFAPDTYQVSGLCQGKFDIERDPRTGEAIIVHPPIELGVILRTLSGDAARPAAMPDRVSLDEFLREALDSR